MDEPPTIVIFGASGLIGEAVAADLMRNGFPVAPVARHFRAAQKSFFAASAIERQFVEMNAQELAQLLTECRADIVVNCVGLLQDSGRERPDDAHRGFVGRLVDALGPLPEPPLLVHLSIPGREFEDHTRFSQTKRDAERIIGASSIPAVILRPGFVVAPSAFGGSALIRALAALPFDLPERESSRLFAATDIVDIARTIAFLARRWRDGERHWKAAWDVMERHPSTVGGVVNAFRRRFGGPRLIARLPSWLMEAGARLADLSSSFGWRAPIRSTALRELQRGVEGDPRPWIAATGIDPSSLEEALAALPATVQERWFARLYLTKAAIIGVLVVFWAASGLIALTVAFDAATRTLTSSGLPPAVARIAAIVTSLADIAIGAAIAGRRSCRAGLLIGIGLSLFYMIGAALLTPGLWIDPLGALVKTGPAIVLMLVALAILDDR